MSNVPSYNSGIRRFRANPVEVAIFSLVTLIFAHSVYNLLYDHSGFEAKALKPMASNPISEGRAPASISQSFLNLSLGCLKPTDQDTTATKIRLSGPICGALPTETTAVDPTLLVKTTIANDANKYNATVFTDLNSGKFSTDYIPLNSGKNPIRVEFSYQGGKTVSQNFTVTKN